MCAFGQKIIEFNHVDAYIDKYKYIFFIPFFIKYIYSTDPSNKYTILWSK